MRKSRKGLFRRRRTPSRRQRGFNVRNRLRFQTLESRLALSTNPTLIDFDSSTVSDPTSFVEVGELTYFVASDTQNGRELWVTDGSVQGTRLVADVNEGEDSSTPTELVELDGQLYFTAFTEEFGRELWTTDGTAEGTMMVADIYEGTYPSNYQDFGNSARPAELTAVDGMLYFSARDGQNGVELWKYDPETEEAELVADINDNVDDETSVPESSNPSNLTDVDGVLYFTANDGENGEELWRSTGTESGTEMVADVFEGTDDNGDPNSSYPGLLVAFEGDLFFLAENDEVGAELWKYDVGSDDPLQLVADINEGEGSAFTNTSQMVVLGDMLLFTADDGELGLELWKYTDQDGVELVEDINEGEDSGLSQFSDLTVIDGMLYFGANDGTNGFELWVSDGNNDTSMLADINDGTNDDDVPLSSDPVFFVQVGDVIYFSAETNEGGRELWQTDGTSSGTVQVDDYALTTSNFNPTNLTNVNDQLFFAGDTEEGPELFTLVEGDSVQMSIYIEGELMQIPGLVGVQEDDSTAAAYTYTDDGQIFFDDGSGVTLGDFFEVWQTDAGLAGNDPDAVLSPTQILEFQTDFNTTLQVFVDGQIVTDFVNHQLEGGEQIDIVYSTNPVVSIVTNFGIILVELYETNTPGTVENFLNYVNDNDFEEVIFHRSSAANGVIQAGGFTTDSEIFTDADQLDRIDTDDPIDSEAGLSNLLGTLGMANTGDPDSATSQFYINTRDNPGFDSNFTVFGTVLDIRTVEAIESLPVIDVTDGTAENGAFGELPVSVDDELVVISSVTGQGELSGTAFFDLDGDGTQDSNEAGIAGAMVFLDLNNSGSFEEEQDVYALTDSEGRYLLQHLPGEYTLMIAPLDGASFSLPEQEDGYSVTVEIGREFSDFDFAMEVGLVPTGLDLVNASDTGASDEDNLTNLNNDSDATFEVLVTGASFGATVNLYADGTLIGSAVAEGSEVVVTTHGTTVLEDGEFELTATLKFGDEQGEASDPLEITIDTTPPAEITSTPLPTVILGEPFGYDAESADEGIDGAVYSVEGAPEGFILIPSNGMIAWPTIEAQTGPVEFTLFLTDAAGNFVSQMIELTVLDPDLSVLPDEYSVDEDGSLTVTAGNGVLENDGDDPADLTAVLEDGGTTQNGVLELFEDGTFTYTPNDDFFGEDSFTYFAVDGDGNEGNVAKVTIVVNPLQDDPVPESDQYNLDEDETLTIDASSGLLANDTDVDGDQLRAILGDTSQLNGELDLADDGSFVYTPDEHYNGPASFTYQVSDGTTTSEFVTVTLTIAAVEDSPVAVADSYDVDEDDVLEINADLGVLANDFEPDGDDITIDLAERPENGSLTLNSNGSFTYTPDADFFGTDTFTYSISDGFRETEATVTIEVESMADDPMALDDVITVIIDGGEQELDVLANDSSDPDGEQELVIVSFTQGDQGGTVELGPDGLTLLYTPPVGFEGTDSFEYTIEDEDGLTATATVLASVSETPSGVIAGVVFLDVDEDGLLGDTEPGIPGVLITLIGTTDNDVEIERTAITDNEGSYSFEDLNPGTYSVTQHQPVVYEDWVETTDSPDAEVGVDETTGDDQITNIVLDETAGDVFVANNFSERRVESGYVSITWFFASNIGSGNHIRDALADAEEAAGNIELANAIREGLLSLDPVDGEEVVEESGLVFEESGERSGEDTPDSATEDQTEADTVLEGSSVVEDTTLEEQDETEAFESSFDEALEETEDWLGV